MRSPSSVATTRKVPCIAGCDGPMLIVMRSNMSSGSSARRRLGLRPVDLVLGQDPAPRRVVVLAQRVAAERLVGEDAPQVRMALEGEAEHVERLALEPVGRLPDAGQAGQPGVVLGHRHLEPQPLAARQRVEVVDRLEALLALRVVDAAEVEQQVVAAVGVVAQLAGQVGQHLAPHHPGGLVEPLLRLDAALRVALKQRRRGRQRRHARISPSCAVAARDRSSA